MNNIKILLNYNFNPRDLLDFSFNRLENLFNSRRDSCFVFVCEDNDNVYAIRDHFGQIPLYYRIYPTQEIKFSISLIDLLDSKCKLDFDGLRYYLGFCTSKIKPPFSEINVVPPGSVVKINKKTKEFSLLYQYQPKAKVYGLKSFDDYINKFEELFLQAIQRTLKSKEVGLLLSGGIDSGLTGYFLKKFGVKINAYTSAPWGRKSSEIEFSKINAEIIKPKNHFISYLELEDHLSSFQQIFSLYKTIHGTSTSLGVAKLYKDFPIENEKQVYYAQNCDTAACAMPAQNVAYFSQFIPHFLRKFFHKDLSYRDCVKNYLSFSTKGLVSEDKEFEKRFHKNLSMIEKLSLAGIFLVHSQSDSEVIIEPLLAQGILVSNPFFDVDLVEFLLGIPLKYRLTFARNTPTKIYIDKLVVRKLASRFFPQELCKRKKGFTIPIEKFLSNDNLPKYEGFVIENFSPDQKFAFKVLLEWCRRFNIKI